MFTVISGVLISSTIIRSSLWSFSGILCILSGLAELLLTCATIPVIGVFLAAKWSVELVPHSADRLVIFICPLGTLLMFVWSSYSTLCLAVWSIGSGIWSVSYLLPSSRVWSLWNCDCFKISEKPTWQWLHLCNLHSRQKPQKWQDCGLQISSPALDLFMSRGMHTCMY